MKNSLKNTQTSRPEPRHSSEFVKNREHIDDISILPPKFAKLTPVQSRVLGHLYLMDRQNRGASVHQLGTTYDTVEAMEQFRILTLRGTQRSWAYITQYGRRFYEVLYWHEQELLERRRSKRRAAVIGKHGKDG